MRVLTPRTTPGTLFAAYDGRRSKLRRKRNQH